LHLSPRTGKLPATTKVGDDMLGGMQDWTLCVTHLIDHAAREHGAREIVSRWADGSETRTDWAGIRRDALTMTQALRAAVDHNW
jgi:hypothetical protein